MTIRGATLLLQETLQQTAWQRMDGAERSQVFLLLASLILVGFVMIVLARFGARITRHYINRHGRTWGPSSGATGGSDGWAKKPMRPACEDDGPGTSRACDE